MSLDQHIPGGSGARVAVVGGGIAGIAAAQQLAGDGHTPVIFEGSAILGGRVALDRLGDREISLGGKNIGRRYDRFRAMVECYGRPRYEFFGPQTAELVRGRPRLLRYGSPAARAAMATRLAARGELRGGRRFLSLAELVKAQPESGFLGDPALARLAAEAGHPTVADYFGATLCSGAIRHVTVRMNAAEPDEAWVGNFGSNLALVTDQFDQLSDGLGPLLHGAALRHAAHLGETVSGLVVDDGRVTGVSTAAGGRLDDFDAVILAIPAPDAARLLDSVDRRLAAVLRGIDYHPVAVVVAEYDRPVFAGPYAALSAPPGMALSNAGSYGLGDRHIVRYTFSGRAARGLVEPATFDPDKLLAEAESFLTRHAGLDSGWRVRSSARAFDPGLCAYCRDHAGFLGEVKTKLDALPGLSLAGDYMRGASLEACTRSGIDAALSLRPQALARAPLPWS